jgi:hypothetical protein
LKGDNAYNEKERELEEQFREVANRAIYQYMKINEVPWLDFTRTLLFVESLLCILKMFYRPDFLTLTVCVLAIYMIEVPERTRRK